MADKRTLWADITGTVLRVLLALVWLGAGIAKAADMDGMQRSIVAFDLVPFAVTSMLAFIIPLVELLIGVLFLLGLYVRYAAVISAVLLIVFTFAIAAAWARGLEIDCGCFGQAGLAPPDPVAGYIRDIARDIALVGASAWLIVRPHTRAQLLCTPGRSR